MAPRCWWLGAVHSVMSRPSAAQVLRHAPGHATARDPNIVRGITSQRAYFPPSAKHHFWLLRPSLPPGFCTIVLRLRGKSASNEINCDNSYSRQTTWEEALK